MPSQHRPPCCRRPNNHLRSLVYRRHTLSRQRAICHRRLSSSLSCSHTLVLILWYLLSDPAAGPRLGLWSSSGSPLSGGFYDWAQRGRHSSRQFIYTFKSLVLLLVGVPALAAILTSSRLTSSAARTTLPVEQNKDVCRSLSLSAQSFLVPLWRASCRGPSLMWGMIELWNCGTKPKEHSAECLSSILR